jgi:arsenite methyltransferase
MNINTGYAGKMSTISYAPVRDLARSLKALADPTRLQLISIVAAAPGQEACACDLTAPVGLSQPTVSHHLKVLTEAGLLSRTQRGTWAHFAIVPGALESVSNLLTGITRAAPADITEQVRERYATAALQLIDISAESGASCCVPTDLGNGNGDVFGSTLYTAGEGSEIPEEAFLASLGCGNPTAVADLRAGETVLDLGSGGGIDVLLSARRVGPSGFAYGLDMTDEMLSLARANADKSEATNVEFLKGQIEEIPLADASIDVIISNCVINLSADKKAVMAEMFRVLKPGGRLGISDVVAENHLSVTDREDRGSLTGCIAGALSNEEYLDALAAAGFVGASVEYTHEVAAEMHGAIVKANKPAAQKGCC